MAGKSLKALQNSAAIIKLTNVDLMYLLKSCDPRRVSRSKIIQLDKN